VQNDTNKKHKYCLKIATKKIKLKTNKVKAMHHLNTNTSADKITNVTQLEKKTALQERNPKGIQCWAFMRLLFPYTYINDEFAC